MNSSLSNYPGVKKGVSKLFVAAVLHIIAIILAIVGMVISVAGITRVVVEGNLDALAAFGAGSILAIAGVILAFVIFVLELIGLINGMKESQQFMIALIIEIIYLVLSIVNAFSGANQVFSQVVSLLSMVMTVFLISCVAQGLRDVMSACGNEVLAKKLNFLYVLATIVAFMFVALDILGNMLLRNPVTAVIALVAIIAAYVLQIIAFILYVVNLSRVRKAMA